MTSYKLITTESLSSTSDMHNSRFKSLPDADQEQDASNHNP